jgi:SAM-dependent methyltransferase
MIEEKPSDNDLRELYDDLFAEGDYAAHREEFQQILAGKVPFRFFRRRLLRKSRRRTRGRRLVEIGGGTGAFAAIARQEGFFYTDYDISQEAVRCQRELGNDAVWFHPSALPPIPPASADVVAMWEVLEHVWDLHGHLSVIRNAVRPPGVFIFSTPNFLRPEYQHALRERAPLSSPPVHVNFFTVESLRTVLCLHGWNEVRFTSNRLRRPQRGIRFLRTAVGLHPAATIYGLAR